MALVTVTAVAGALALRYLGARGWVNTGSTVPGRRRYLIAAGVALAFSVEAVTADLLVARLPADASAPLPWSMPFYAVMGYLVEVGVGIVPLALVLGAGAALIGRPADDKRARSVLAWAALALVSLPEAVFQGATSVPGGPSFAAWYIGCKVFAFNLVQLSLFRRFDFATMFVFRIVYYAAWHVAWGQLRLQLLF